MMQNAQKEILEVLLNRPDLLQTVKQVIAEPDDFTVETYRAIAQRIWQCAGQSDQPRLTQVLAGVETVSLSDLITAMAQCGADRSNFEQTLTGALDSIKQCRAEQVRDGVRRLVSTAAEQYGKDAETAALLEYQSKWQPNQRRAGGA